MDAANLRHGIGVKLEIAALCYIVPFRSTLSAEPIRVWLQMSNSAELQNIAMEICFSILKASWQRKHMFVNNIHRRGVWIEYGSHLHLQ